jgi:pimeloyl-ACP methyl ester carboxylesterase
VRAFLLQSLDLKAPGGPAWRLNLDALGANMPAILGWPDLPGAFAGPTLFLSGALSDYVRPEHRDTIRARFPAARFARIPGAGHWLHADRPEAFAAAVAAFLDAPAA